MQIHKFTLGDRLLVYDVGSGALHAVDRVAWDLLDLHPDYPPQRVATLAARYGPGEVAGAEDEIAALVAEGTLFAPDPPGEVAGEAGLPVKALCLNVAHSCNLRCRYCFAGQGSFGGERELMPAEVGRAAVDFLLKGAGGGRNLEVDFFGGEPLLNFPSVRETIEYAERRAAQEGKVIHFTLTTNATLVDDRVIAYLREKQVSLILSLDGRPEVHDRMRGDGTYTAAVDGIRRMLAGYPEADHYLRGTFTRHNRDFAADARHFLAQGFRRFSLEPVVGLNEDYTLREQDLAELSAQYEELAEIYLAHQRDKDPFVFFHFQLDLTGGPCLNKRLRGCGAGTEYLAVTPKGDLYPCHQFVGREDTRLGNLAEGGVTRPELAAKFHDNHVLAKAACRECWARYLCGGGCHANAHLSSGRLDVPDALGCALGKKRLETALGVQARLAELA